MINNAEDEEKTFQELLDSFLHHHAFHSESSLREPSTDDVLISNPHPPSPPPSEPDVDHPFDPNIPFMQIIDILDQDFYTALANDLGFPELPTNWKRILYHAYTRMYAATVLQFPCIHRNTLVVQSINFAKHCCEQSNLLWTAEEHHQININGVPTPASLSQNSFRTKFNATVTKAEGAFHDRALKGTIYLLTSRPGYSALMPHLPGPPGTKFSPNQRSVTNWFLTWSPAYGYVYLWHGFSGNQIQWFGGDKLRNLLFCALREQQSPGYLSLQEAYQTDEGIWTWRPLQVQGAAALSVISYVLASVNVSIRADFLQEQGWDQDTACPDRRALIKEEQSTIYQFLHGIHALAVPANELSPELLQTAYNGLTALLAYLGYSV